MPDGTTDDARWSTALSLLGERPFRDAEELLRRARRTRALASVDPA